jgi:hypothetical protein
VYSSNPADWFGELISMVVMALGFGALITGLLSVAEYAALDVKRVGNEMEVAMMADLRFKTW